MKVSGRSQVKIWDTRLYGYIGVPQGAVVFSDMATYCEASALGEGFGQRRRIPMSGARSMKKPTPTTDPNTDI
jgi:hypothetical protein